MSVSAGKTGLILGDEWLIAADVAVTFENADAASAPSFRRCTDVENFLRDKTPDFAVLDLALSDGRSSRVARMLTERRVPFIVYSEFARPPGESIFSACPWVAKPAEECALLAVLESEVLRRDPRSEIFAPAARPASRCTASALSETSTREKLDL